MDDDELIAAVAAGDDTALRELFTRRAPWWPSPQSASPPPGAGCRTCACSLVTGG